jgi:2-dehydropantoate 2-reductase
VLEETNRIATAEGYPMPPATVDLVHWLFSQPGSQYGPSMLEDVEHGRKTEGEHVIGDMVDRAARHGIAAPILTAARCNLQVYELNRVKA